MPIWLLLLTLVGATTGSAIDRAEVPALLLDKAVERTRTAQVISPRLEKLAATRSDGMVKVWVFFTDKGIHDKAGFDRAASSVTLTDRALRRRAKVGLNRVVFVDLPVTPEYVTAIEKLGAGHRRSSRWLNAASFEMRAELLSRVSRFPFVAEMRPVLTFQRAPEPEVETRGPEPDQALAEPHTLDYGPSFFQLEQINVPAAHDRGYSGLGVTLAIHDTGYRKTHDAFALHFAEGRVLAEYDFVYNDANTDYDDDDWASEISHGTKVWSVAGGHDDGNIYGPAYRANFILCKTEDIRSETNVEEDNWVAALEFSDSIGADVITTSLGYMIFDDTCNCDYTYEDLDGRTAIISIAASMCDGLGIVMCNSAGNSGSLGAGSITPPADAFDILAVGSVSESGIIAGSSSRGPTYDGRIKPEVCARGISTYAAHPSYDDVFTYFSGTSASTPLIAGAACLLIEAHPDWTPYQVREALKASGDHADSPDNTYGWGIVDVDSALQMEPECCRGKVGDANGLGGDEPTIGDIAVMIDFLFINRTPINCLKEADVNQSGETDPAFNDVTIGDISVLIDYLFITGPELGLPDCL